MQSKMKCLQGCQYHVILISLSRVHHIPVLELVLAIFYLLLDLIRGLNALEIAITLFVGVDIPLFAREPCVFWTLGKAIVGTVACFAACWLGAKPMCRRADDEAPRLSRKVRS